MSWEACVGLQIKAHASVACLPQVLGEFSAQRHGASEGGIVYCHLMTLLVFGLGESGVHKSHREREMEITNPNGKLKGL